MTDKYANPPKPPQAATTEVGPPPGDAEVRLAVHALLANFQARTGGGDLPKPFPPGLRDAIDWWVHYIQEPAHRSELPHRVPTRGKEGYRWEYGYLTRVQQTLGRFLAMTPEAQSLVVRAREDGWYWRGEDMQSLQLNTAEVARMREVGRDAYIREVVDRCDRLGVRVPTRGTRERPQERDEETIDGPPDGGYWVEPEPPEMRDGPIVDGWVV